MVKLIKTTGKRKRAVARAVLRPGKGVVKINNNLMDLYQPDMARLKLQEPLILAGDVAKTVDVSINVFGGGYMAQAEAARLALAKALVKHTKRLEKPFSDYDRHLLVADVRRKETRKPNTHGKARSKRQKSYR
ncbi:30S ribosomal protein S9 [Candidatus Woesearchaeota archaeon]|nr:30S ribosomal protein S9 [Candidatus Woesearchaeota archaeon]